MQVPKLAECLLWPFILEGQGPCFVWKCDILTVLQECDTVTEHCGLTFPDCDSCTSMTPVRDIWTFILMWYNCKNILHICQYFQDIWVGGGGGDIVSVLGQDKGYTVKYNPLSEGVPEGEAGGNSWRQRVIFDSKSRVES